MITPRIIYFGVEWDGEFEDYHVCSDDLEDLPDGSRNSLVDTKDRDTAFRVVEHLKKPVEGPYRHRCHADDSIDILTKDATILIVLNDPVKAGRLLGYLNR